MIEPTLKLWLVRHGETTWNSERRAQGHLDVPLSSLGRDQATMLAHRLRGTSFDAIYSSDLSRALETARIVNSNLGGRTQVLADARWREQMLGALQGLNTNEVAAMLEARGATRPVLVTDRYPDAESRAELMERIKLGLQELIRRHPDGRVIVFSHGGSIRAATSVLLGDTEQKLNFGGLENTSITRFRMPSNQDTNLRGTMLAYNDSAHLEHNYSSGFRANADEA
jgi:2,3-bisphosphoglycerate-dependent phosphoglycerate mutase